MRCPSCLVSLDESVDSCQACGFHLASLDKKFGTVPRNYRHVSDLSGLFTADEQELLTKKISDIERNFPGLFMAVMSMEVHRHFNPREYLFWLVNRCQFTPMEYRLENSFLVVLFFETRSRKVFLTTGYGLDLALPEERMDEILQVGLTNFSRDNHYHGTISILREIKRQLIAFCSAVPGQTTPVSQLKNGATLKPAEEIF